MFMSCNIVNGIVACTELPEKVHCTSVHKEHIKLGGKLPGVPTRHIIWSKGAERAGT